MKTYTKKQKVEKTEESQTLLDSIVSFFSHTSITKGIYDFLMTYLFFVFLNLFLYGINNHLLKDYGIILILFGIFFIIFTSFKITTNNGLFSLAVITLMGEAIISISNRQYYLNIPVALFVLKVAVSIWVIEKIIDIISWSKSKRKIK